MMALPLTRRVKVSTEVRRYVFNFFARSEVVAGETLSSPTVTVSPSGPTISGAAVLTSSLAGVPSGKGVSATISGGTAGTTYTLTCTVTTSGGSTLVCKGELEVV